MNKYFGNEKVKYITSFGELIPLFEELKYFYNNDVCISCVICISIMKSTKYNLRTFAYYYENAVHRIEETWEYVHILLAEILDLELFVGKDIRDANIKYCKVNGIMNHKDMAGKLGISSDIYKKISAVLVFQNSVEAI